jgi:large subunit ribosomal protein L3
MTAIWNDKGERLPVTILQISRAQVLSVKTKPKHGYWAVQIGVGYRDPRNVSKAMLGYFAAAKVAPKAHVGEFRIRDASGLLPVGRTLIYCDAYARDGDHSLAFHGGAICRHSGPRVPILSYMVLIRSRKGKGFAGVMKRHGFHGLRASHGVSIKHRSGGSTGGSQDPGRVLPGKKMAGHMGTKNVTTSNVQVVKVEPNLGLILVKGAVPGPTKGLVYMQDAMKL